MAVSTPAPAASTAVQRTNPDKLFGASATAPQRSKTPPAAEVSVRLRFPKQCLPPHVVGCVRPSNVRPVSPSQAFRAAGRRRGAGFQPAGWAGIPARVRDSRSGCRLNPQAKMPARPCAALPLPSSRPTAGALRAVRPHSSREATPLRRRVRWPPRRELPGLRSPPPRQRAGYRPLASAALPMARCPGTRMVLR